MLTKDFNPEKFEEIFPHVENILQCGMYYFDGERAFWSKGMYNILGIVPYSIKSSFENFSQYVVAEDRDRISHAINLSRIKGIPYKLEFSLLDANGTYKKIYAENSVKSGNNNFISYSGIIKDITESYFYKKALEQKVVQLNKSNKNLEEFVYAASHDLQEPLRKITTFVERLKQKFGDTLDDEASMYINRVEASGNGMRHLLMDLLEFSRLREDSKPYEKISLKECIDNVLNDLEIKIEETRTTVIFQGLAFIDAYPTQLKQLFLNLIGNSIKFRKPGHDPVINISCEIAPQEKYLHLRPEKPTSYVEIIVEDNGIGFDDKFSEKIFVIFQRLNSKAEYPGSGIGLSICKKVIENHHGFIFARGVQGRGATFTILIPQNQS